MVLIVCVCVEVIEVKSVVKIKKRKVILK